MKYVVVAFHVGNETNAHFSTLLQYDNEDVVHTTTMKYRSALRLALRWGRSERHPCPVGLFEAAQKQNMNCKNFKLSSTCLGAFKTRELAKERIKEEKEASDLHTCGFTKVTTHKSDVDICDASSVNCSTSTDQEYKAWAIKELKEVIFDRVVNHEDSAFGCLEFSEDEVLLVKQLFDRWS